MKTYPLVFSFRTLVAGKGYYAGVEIRGRVLLCEEKDGFWMYGVQPGSIAGGGVDRGTAFCDFEEGYKSVLYDIAADVDNYTEFEREANEFFGQVNGPTEKDWYGALAKVRRSRTALPGIDKVDADRHPPSFRVFEVDVQRSTPNENSFNLFNEAA